jgi:hypothetical protein
MSFAFGQPSCGSALRCVAAHNLRTCGRAFRCRRALRLRCGAQLADMPCVAFMRPSCRRALRCVGVPNLGEAVLKSIPPRQNLFLSILQLVFWPSAPLCGRFRCRFVLRLGDHLADMPCVALGCPTCRRADVPCVCVADVRWGAQLPDVPCVCVGAPNLWMCLSLRTCLAFALRTCVGVPNLRTCLALRWVAQLANVPCVAFGRPSCGRASRFVGAPNLGEVVLKILPPSKNLILSILQLVF